VVSSLAEAHPSPRSSQCKRQRAASIHIHTNSQKPNPHIHTNSQKPNPQAKGFAGAVRDRAGVRRKNLLFTLFCSSFALFFLFFLSFFSPMFTLIYIAFKASCETMPGDLIFILMDRAKITYATVDRWMPILLLPQVVNKCTLIPNNVQTLPLHPPTGRRAEHACLCAKRCVRV
jgi:hypothetical protein